MAGVGGQEIPGIGPGTAQPAEGISPIPGEGSDRENMENQRDILVERMESEFGLLDKLRKSLTVMEIADVRSRPTTFEKNKRLLELIFENNKHQDLIRALTDTRQTHLVNWVRGNGEYRIEFVLDWPLRKRETEILEDNQENWTDLLDPCELISLLFSKKVINKRQMDFIQIQRATYEKNEELLNILRRCSRTAFSITVDCLRASNQVHIAEMLEGSGAVVQAHANLDADQLDETETQIVREVTSLMLQATENRTSLLLQELQIRIIAARKGSSIVLYIYCETVMELMYLCEVINKKELKDKLENIFNTLLHGMSTRVIDLYIVETEINKAKKFFEREANRDKQFDEEISRLREQIRHKLILEKTSGEASSDEEEKNEPMQEKTSGEASSDEEEKNEPMQEKTPGEASSDKEEKSFLFEQKEQPTADSEEQMSASMPGRRDDDPRFFYYKLDCLVRELPDMALIRIGQPLMTTMPCRDWRAIGDLLGYTMTEMDNFERRQIAGYDLLKDWSTRRGSTIRVLQSKLQQISRHDIVTVLHNIRQNPITLDVVIHDSEPPFDTERGYSLTPEIRGRKELWDGLLSLLKIHVTRVTTRRRYTFFNLRELSWQNYCREYQGQQVDIDVRHQDSTPSDSAPGFSAREVEPSCHLMSPTQLRFSRNICAVTTGSTSSDGAKVIRSSAPFKPEVKDTSTWKKESRTAWKSWKGNDSQSEGHKQPTKESACGRDAAESLKRVKKRVSFSCEKESNATKQSLDLDLRSCEGPSGPRELPHHENTRKKLIDLNLRGEERLSRSHETDVAPRSETSTISLWSADSLAENCATELRDQDSYSSAVVNIARSSSAAGPGERSEQELMELRENDLLLENENLVSGGFVKEEEATDQQSRSFTRRHVYFLPKSELVRSQCPGLWDLSGFHPKLKHKISLISEVMKPYEKTDGWYLIRAFLSDENMTKVDLALTVTYKGKMKHFMILQQWDSNPRRYFLFSRDYEAKSISDLIDHYKIHPLTPGSLLVSGTNLPKLINPIPRDSFNYM